jgi:hypothetical protein
MIFGGDGDLVPVWRATRDGVMQQHNLVPCAFLECGQARLTELSNAVTNPRISA